MKNYVCGGVMHVGDHDIHCSNRSGHGPETLKQALENSCNVALMQIGASIGTRGILQISEAVRIW